MAYGLACEIPRDGSRMTLTGWDERALQAVLDVEEEIPPAGGGMSVHWAGLANPPGIVTLAVTIAVWQVLVILACLFAIYVFGSLVWQVWDYGVRRRRSGQSPEQFVQASEHAGATVEPGREAMETPARTQSSNHSARQERSSAHLYGGAGDYISHGRNWVYTCRRF